MPEDDVHRGAGSMSASHSFADSGMMGTCEQHEAIIAELGAQRRRAEELSHQLRLERDLGETIMSNTRAHLAYLDSEFRFVRVNAAYAEGSGHSEQELIGQNHFELFPDEENEAIFRQVLESGQPASFRAKPFVFPDRPELGTTYWDWTLTPIRGDDGAVEGLVFSLLDVTEHQRAMLALHRREEAFRALAENAPDIIARFDHNLRCTYVNPAAEAVTGIPGDTLLDDLEDPSRLICAFAPTWRDHISAVFISGSESLLRSSLPTDEGTRHFETRFSPEFALDGSVASVLAIGRDVTEQEFLLEEHRRQSEFLQRVVETAPIAIAVVGRDGLFKAVNPSFHGIPWAKRAPEPGLFLKDVFPDPVTQTAKYHVQRAYQTGDVSSVREDHVVVGQVESYWDVDHVPLRDAEGRVEDVVIIAHEITEEVVARQRAERLAARNRAILYTMGEGLIVFDLKGHILELNPAGQQLHGLSQPSGTGTAIESFRGGFDVYHLDGRPMSVEERPMTRVLRGETINNVEVRMRNPDGRRWVASYGGALVRDAQGAPFLGILTVRDITAMKEAEEKLAALNVTLEGQVLERTSALRASEMRFRAIFEDAGIGMALIHPDGRLAVGNRALQRMLACTAEEFPEHHLTDFCHAEDREAVAALIEELRQRRRRLFRTEQRYVAHDGRVGWANVTGSAIVVVDDAPGLAIIMFEDITERREAQHTLVQAARINAVGELAASLTHEINNPLQAAIGCLQLAVETLAQDDPNLRYLGVATEELQRAARLVRQLRDMNRPTRSFERRASDVVAVVDEVLHLAGRECQSRGITVTLDAPKSVHLPVIADQIRQVLLNLVLNAMDAMPNGGELHVSIEPTEQPAGARIVVRDTGIGIPPEITQRIFDLFFTTKDDGLGMGLHVTREIVQEHGGTIEVESELNRGSAFRIWLPEDANPPDEDDGGRRDTGEGV